MENDNLIDVWARPTLYSPACRFRVKESVPKSTKVTSACGMWAAHVVSPHPQAYFGKDTCFHCRHGLTVAGNRKENDEHERKRR